MNIDELKSVYGMVVEVEAGGKRRDRYRLMKYAGNHNFFAVRESGEWPKVVVLIRREHIIDRGGELKDSEVG